MSTPPIVIIGAGLAGLAAALRLAPRPVWVVAAASAGSGAASAWSQGGVAAALAADDSASLHAADTRAAGAGLVDPTVAAAVAADGPDIVSWLIEQGVQFDRDAQGGFALSHEAAHSRRRVLRANGDATGAELMRALVARARETPSIRLVSPARALALIPDAQGRIAGVAVATPSGVETLPAAAIVLATGGAGQLYARTTNPPVARGDGIVLAARAGAALADLEFVQFHPTALAVEADPAPLVTEALRGDGAVLIDQDGRRFMADSHPDAELAPRDVVARGVWGVLRAGGRAYLDARTAIGAGFPQRFPTVHAACVRHGIDPVTAPIPVAPAAHYHMGGVWTDARGRTSLPGLHAAGEVAATGLHGANRLASNSLLEALSFGFRIAADLAGADLPDRPRPDAPPAPVPAPADATVERALRARAYADLGVVRSEPAMSEADAWFAATEAAQPAGPTRDLALLARLVARAARLRRESRGGHARSDCPATDPAQATRRVATAPALLAEPVEEVSPV